MKVAQLFYAQGAISQDTVLICEEVYLQKGTQYHDGECVPVVIRAVPENKAKGE